MYRQGDVLIVPVEEVPDGLKQVEKEKGRVVLAHGEVTGHAHAVEGDAQLLAEPPADAADELITPAQAEELERMFLFVGDGGAQVVHEEHGTIALSPGRHEVRRQREYAPEEIRRVAD